MHKRPTCVALILGIVLAPLGALAQEAETPLGDPVLHWNAIALQAVADDHSGTFGDPDQGGPGKTSRALALVHATIYDAVNSITRTHEPYHAQYPLDGNPEVSVDAAVARAAHATLSALYPKQKLLFDADLLAHLGAIPDSPAKTLGEDVGTFVAQSLLAARSTDGSDAAENYTPSDAPGRHRKDPLNPGQPFLGPSWGFVTPFAIESGAQFRAPALPTLESAEYATAYEEAKNFGGDGVITPTLRTPEQTEIGIYWGYDGTKNLGTPPRLYNQIARVIAEQKGNSVSENARLFALINIAQADAGIGSWESKYVYDYWRPIIAIREADEGMGPTGLDDGNPLTSGDPSWTPLGAPASNQSNNGVNFTPPFPAYPSGHATFGAAAFRSIALFYGTDEIPFTFTSDELNGVTADNLGNVRPLSPRSFARLSDAIAENAQSRIYLGIHWQFDATAGIAMGKSIAEYAFGKILQPVEDSSSSSSSSSSASSESSVSSESSSSEAATPPPVQSDIPAQNLRSVEESASHRGSGANETRAAMTYLMSRWEPEKHRLTGHYSLKRITPQVPQSEFVASRGEHMGNVSARNYTVLCSMRDYLRNKARTERSNELTLWVTSELSTMLEMDAVSIEDALTRDSGGLCVPAVDQTAS